MAVTLSVSQERGARARWWQLGWPLAYLVGVAALLFATYDHWAYDDPFITYRYAQNLLRGLGFVYNPGQPVLSTTTPLFTLLLAALGALWPNLPHLANLIGALSVAAGALCLWDLGATWRTPWAGWAGLLLYPLFPLLLTTFGSETPLYIALCLGALAAYARQRYIGSALLASLALLARADGLLIALVLGANFVLARDRPRRPIPWRAIAVYLVVALPWFLFATWEFGTPLPATLAAKQQQGSMAVSQRFAPGLLALLRHYGTWPYWLQAALATAGALFAAARARSWGLLYLWTGTYFAAYTALQVSSYFWYYAPLIPGWLALVGLGLEALASARTAARPALRRAPVLAAAALLVALSLGQGWSALVALPRLQDARYLIYQAAGEWLRAETPGEATVGTLEVGIIGYYAEREMVDFAGLIQPAVGEQLSGATSYESAVRWALAAYHPDYLVLNPAWFPAVMQEQVQPHCAARQTLAGAAYGYSGELIIYQCTW